MAELNIARKCKGMAISSITCLEKYVPKLEVKEKILRKDELAINGYIKRLKILDTDFKGYHCSIIDLVEEDEKAVAILGLRIDRC